MSHGPSRMLSVASPTHSEDRDRTRSQLPARPHCHLLPSGAEGPQNRSETGASEAGSRAVLCRRGLGKAGCPPGESGAQPARFCRFPEGCAHPGLVVTAGQRRLRPENLRRPQLAPQLANGDRCSHTQPRHTCPDPAPCRNPMEQVTVKTASSRTSSFQKTPILMTTRMVTMGTLPSAQLDPPRFASEGTSSSRPGRGNPANDTGVPRKTRSSAG